MLQLSRPLTVFWLIALCSIGQAAEIHPAVPGTAGFPVTLPGQAIVPFLIPNQGMQSEWLPYGLGRIYYITPRVYRSFPLAVRTRLDLGTVFARVNERRDAAISLATRRGDETLARMQKIILTHSPRTWSGAPFGDPLNYPPDFRRTSFDR